VEFTTAAPQKRTAPREHRGARGLRDGTPDALANLDF